MRNNLSTIFEDLPEFKLDSVRTSNMSSKDGQPQARDISKSSLFGGQSGQGGNYDKEIGFKVV